jgi:hypothetical protein
MDLTIGEVPKPPTPPKIGDLYTNAQLWDGPYSITVTYATQPLQSFTLQNKSLLLTLEVCRVFFLFGDLHENWDWSEAGPSD